MEINDYPNYLIYEDGRVWSKTTNKFLKPSYNKDGYLQIALCKNGKKTYLRLHRLIALHYIPNPHNKLEVDHINRITDDNRIENLQWLTQQENKDRRITISNTGEKHINISIYNQKNKIYKYYNIEKRNYFRKRLSCKKHTLQDAIKLRDDLLIEYNII